MENIILVPMSRNEAKYIYSMCVFAMYSMDVNPEPSYLKELFQARENAKILQNCVDFIGLQIRLQNLIDASIVATGEKQKRTYEQVFIALVNKYGPLFINGANEAEIRELEDAYKREKEEKNG